MLQQLHYLILDLKRWPCSSVRDLFYAVFEQGIWATVLFRLSRLLYLVNIPVVKILLRFCAFLIFKVTETLLGVAIPASTEIGPGLYIGHTGLIRIHPEVKIGKNLSLGPGVFIAQKGMGHQGVPVLGDNVYIGVGAKILGNVKIGSNARIGANAVVIDDVPDGATAAGIPAQIVRKR